MYCQWPSLTAATILRLGHRSGELGDPQSSAHLIDPILNLMKISFPTNRCVTNIFGNMYRNNSLTKVPLVHTAILI